MAQRKSEDGKNYQSGEARGGKVIAEYIYCDAEGTNYHMIQRTENKQFPQSQWVPSSVGSSNGKWVEGAPKYKVPYNLPTLIANRTKDKSRPIFICEGEKDADSVDGIGLVSTCNPGGCGKWTPELNKWFKGFDNVYILQDNDRIGKWHSIQVAEQILKLVKTVKIVRIPGLQKKGDVSDFIKSGGTREQLLQFAGEAPTFRIMPTITVTHNKAEMCDEFEELLIEAKQPVVKRGFKLFQPLYSSFRSSVKNSEGEAIMTRSVLFRSLTAIELADLAEKYVCWFEKWNAKEKCDVITDTSMRMLEQFLHRGHWDLPYATGVISTPTLRPDGTILDKPGYDDTTQFWYYRDSNLNVPDIKKKPTKDDASAALSRIRSLFDEVPFSGADEEERNISRSVAMSAIMTPILRCAFMMAPFFVFRAHAAGTGKSYLVNMISTMANGNYCPMVSFRGDADEREKRLGGLLMEGLPLLCLDNIPENAEINDTLLCQMVEQPLIKVRVLGESTMQNCEWRGTILASGNNIQVSDDMTRRSMTCSLASNVENPENRKFKRDPIREIADRRGGFIADILTIARAYHLSKDKPKDIKPLNSFDGWSHFVREPLIWLGEEDPCRSIQKAKDEDPAIVRLKQFVKIWLSYRKGDDQLFGKLGYINPWSIPIRAADIMRLGVEDEYPDGGRGGSNGASNNNGNGADHDVTIVTSNDNPKRRPDLYAWLSENCANTFSEKTLSQKRLGKFLSKIHGKVIHVETEGIGVGSYCIEIHGTSEAGHYWKLSRKDAPDAQVTSAGRRVLRKNEQAKSQFREGKISES